MKMTQSLSPHSPSKKSGFTLIEMLVSVGIFSVVATVALMALLNIKSLQAKAAALRAITNNINFALELMSREIRTGKGYSPLSLGGCDARSDFTFTNDEGKEVTYGLADGAVTRSEDGGPALVLTAPEVVVDRLQFNICGQFASDSLQPVVTIVLNARTVSEKVNLNADLNVQTTVSQRELDS